LDDRTEYSNEIQQPTGPSRPTTVAKTLPDLRIRPRPTPLPRIRGFGVRVPGGAQL